MAVDALATVFVAVGFLATVLGVGLMYYSAQDQEENNSGWFFQDAGRTDENIQRYNAGRVLSIGGFVVLLVGITLGVNRRT
ncbi:MAG: hypothetical protein AABY18_07525 [Candidatus Thermoplasmatota archaeon]